MQFVLIVLINILDLLVIQILDLKTEEKCFFLIQISVKKNEQKNCYLDNFLFLGIPPNYTNWEVMFLIQQSHVQWGI